MSRTVGPECHCERRGGDRGGPGRHPGRQPPRGPRRVRGGLEDGQRPRGGAGAQGVTDWYAGGVAVTCRWLATASMRSGAGPGRLTRSPATRRARVAYEELIEAEYLAAESLEERRPDMVEHEPGWC